MITVIKNTFIIFRNNKGYFASIVIMPLMMLAIVSLFLSFDADSVVAVTGAKGTVFEQEFEENVKASGSLCYKNIDEDEVSSNLVSGSADVVVIINENADEMIKAGIDGAVVVMTASESSDLSKAVKYMIRSAEGNVVNGRSNAEVSVNKVKKTTLPVSNSLGMVMFKLITGGQLLGVLILEDKKKGRKGRVYLSGIKPYSYLGGMGIVYLVGSIASSIVYFLAAMLFRFDMGIEHKLMILPVLFTANIFSMCFAVFISSIASKPEQIWSVSSLIVMPTSILSGAILPYNQMPEVMQKIANIFPQRWMLCAFEQLQHGRSFSEAAVYMGLTLLLGLVLFAIGAIRFKKTV